MLDVNHPHIFAYPYIPCKRMEAQIRTDNHTFPHYFDIENEDGTGLPSLNHKLFYFCKYILTNLGFEIIVQLYGCAFVPFPLGPFPFR